MHWNLLLIFAPFPSIQPSSNYVSQEYIEATLGPYFIPFSILMFALPWLIWTSEYLVEVLKRKK